MTRHIHCVLEHVAVEVEPLPMPSRNFKVHLSDQREEIADGHPRHISGTYCGPGHGFDGWPADLDRPKLEQATITELRDWLADTGLTEGHMAAFERVVAGVWRMRADDLAREVSNG